MTHFHRMDDRAETLVLRGFLILLGVMLALATGGLVGLLWTAVRHCMASGC